MHISATTFVDWPEWEKILGGRWVRGTSMHPDQDLARVLVATYSHSMVAGIGDFTVFDERYSYLRVSPEVEELAWHEEGGLRHPLLWTHRYGPARVVFDALGHDARSFESPQHREILARAARWLTAETS
jgi:type 1 glutamine amidotransferase